MQKSFCVTGLFRWRLAAAIPLLLLLNGCAHSPQAMKDRSLATGRKLMDKGDYRRALLEFKNAVQAVPRDAEAQFELGNAYAANGDLGSAASSYMKVTELDPKNKDAERRLAQLMTI